MHRLAAEQAFPLFDDAPETAVVVLGVVELAFAPRDDAPRASIARPGCLHRELAVIAALAHGQEFLPVVERPAVLRITKGSAGLDECNGMARLRRQIRKLRFGDEGERGASDEPREPGQPPHGYCGFLRRRCSSRSWFSVTGVGVPVRRSWPRWVLGNALTSRIVTATAISDTRRTMMTEKPACCVALY